MAESSSQVEPARFRFNDLPAELKLIIIKAALPEQRIFHVSGRWTDESEPKETGADTQWYGGSPDADAARWAAIRHVGVWCEYLHSEYAGNLLEQNAPFIEPFVEWGPVLAMMRNRMPVLHSVTFMVPMHVWTTDKLPRLDGTTYVLPRSWDRDGWRRIFGRRHTREWPVTKKQRRRGPRRNWCRCRRKWMCPVTYFEP
ncbi:hypothetical protein ACQRIU_001748 [Beauveria bassiana]